jgi:hypothetical protein
VLISQDFGKKEKRSSFCMVVLLLTKESEESGLVGDAGFGRTVALEEFVTEKTSAGTIAPTRTIRLVQVGRGDVSG